MSDQVPNDRTNHPLATDLDHLVEMVVKAVITVSQTRSVEEALMIRDELRRLPDDLTTEILNQVMLSLVKIDPDVCRWFILDVFLHNADPEGKADVAERLNLLFADLQSH
ncbi:hypothetical protein [Pantanalinema sp. GBBB05]|uniref:hypothetical protein n=1 Tax=Pantanalinema sp. GBBB05 TaxID=2604139 RepID=UPI001DC61F54|nr:hypothetical protein [Pantanalinema sp. GBBB05]